MKLGEIILKLRYRLDDVTTDVEGEYKDEELIKYINEALAWFCRVLREYKITDNTVAIRGNGVNSSDLGDCGVVDGHTLPSTMFDVERVIESHTVNVGTENEKTYKKLLIRKTRYDLEDLYPVDGVRENPKYYCVENNMIYIYPTKSAGNYTLNIRGYAIQELEKETQNDEILWFRENYQAPFLDACEYFARRTRPTVEGNMQICQVLNNNVLSFFNERGRVEPRQAGVK